MTTWRWRLPGCSGTRTPPSRRGRAPGAQAPLDTSTMYSAELLFWSTAPSTVTPETLLLSAVRNIIRRITTDLNGSSASFLCAFGAVVGEQTYACLANQIDGYVALSRSGDGRRQGILLLRSGSSGQSASR